MSFLGTFFKTRWRGFVIRADFSPNPPGSEKTSEKLFKNVIFH
ncbi:hypothetical protein V5739_00670 [Salinimicrobium sp. TIG7-5_MAKvit]